MRVASRMTAISRGLLIARSASMQRIEILQLRLAARRPSASGGTALRARCGRPTGRSSSPSPQRRGIAGRRFAEDLGPEGRVDRASVARRSSGQQLSRTRRAAATASTPSDRGRVVARTTGAGPYIRCSRRSLYGGRNSVVFFVRPSITDDRARLDDAGEVEELVVLPQRLLAGPFGRPLQDRDAVADVRHHLRAPRRELLRRKDVGAGEDGLGEREDRCGEQGDGGGE